MKEMPHFETGLWAISSFETSADQLAEKMLRATPSHVKWLGYRGRPYQQLLTNQIELPKWASDLHGTIGILFVFILFWRFYQLCRFVTQAFLATNIQGIVVVDFSSFHMRMISALKRRRPSIKVIYVSPPKTWATRSSRVKWLQKNVDQCIVLYVYEKKYFEKEGIPCILLQHLSENLPIKQSDFEQQKTKPIKLVIYPGSRRSELRKHIPLVLKAIRALQRRGVCLQVYISVPPNLWLQKDKFYPSQGDFQLFCEEFCPIDTYAIAWVCSGTMTTKVASLGLPMLVMYALDRFSYVFMRFILRYRNFLAIPNLTFEKEVYPELVGPALTIDTLVQTHLDLWHQHMLNPQVFLRLSESWNNLSQQSLPWQKAVQPIFASSPGAQQESVR